MLCFSFYNLQNESAPQRYNKFSNPPNGYKFKGSKVISSKVQKLESSKVQKLESYRFEKIRKRSKK